MWLYYICLYTINIGKLLFIHKVVGRASLGNLHISSGGIIDDLKDNFMLVINIKTCIFVHKELLDIIFPRLNDCRIMLPAKSLVGW